MANTIDIVKKCGGKFFLGLWILIATIFIGSTVTGYFQKDVLGYIAFSILPATILANLSVIISYAINKGNRTIAKTGWISIAILILGIVLYAFDGKPNSDVTVLLSWSMLLLSFPAGFIVPLINVGLYEFFSIEFPTTYLSLGMNWMCFFILGYLQWFKLLPYKKKIGVRS